MPSTRPIALSAPTTPSRPGEYGRSSAEGCGSASLGRRSGSVAFSHGSNGSPPSRNARTSATNRSGWVWWAACRAPGMTTTRPSGRRRSSAHVPSVNSGRAVAADELEDRDPDRRVALRARRPRRPRPTSRGRGSVRRRPGPARSAPSGRPPGRRRSSRRPRPGSTSRRPSRSSAAAGAPRAGP